MGTLARDIRQTFRQLARNRDFAVAAVLTIALGRSACEGRGSLFAQLVEDRRTENDREHER